MESPKKKIIRCWGPLEVKERGGGGDLQGGCRWPRWGRGGGWDLQGTLGGAGEQGLGLQGTLGGAGGQGLGLQGGREVLGQTFLLKIRTCF